MELHAPEFELAFGVAVVGGDDLVRHERLRVLRFFVFESATNQPLDGVQGAVGICLRLATGDVTDKSITVVCEAHHGWCGSRSLVVRYDHWVAMLAETFIFVYLGMRAPPLRAHSHPV